MLIESNCFVHPIYLFPWTWPSWRRLPHRGRRTSDESGKCKSWHCTRPRTRLPFKRTPIDHRPIQFDSLQFTRQFSRFLDPFPVSDVGIVSAGPDLFHQNLLFPLQRFQISTQGLHLRLELHFGAFCHFLQLTAQKRKEKIIKKTKTITKRMKQDQRLYEEQKSLKQIISAKKKSLWRQFDNRHSTQVFFFQSWMSIAIRTNRFTGAHCVRIDSLKPDVNVLMRPLDNKQEAQQM